MVKFLLHEAHIFPLIRHKKNVFGKFLKNAFFIFFSKGIQQLYMRNHVVICIKDNHNLGLIGGSLLRYTNHYCTKENNQVPELMNSDVSQFLKFLMRQFYLCKR